MLAQATRELGQACVGVAGVQHVLGDARVDVEHAPSELGHVPNLGELPLGMALPRAGGVCEQRLEIGELSAFALRFVDQRGGHARPAGALRLRSPAYQATIPAATARRACWAPVVAVTSRSIANPAPGSPAAVSARACLMRRSVEAVRGRRVGGGGERPRGTPVAGGVAQIAQQLQQLTAVRGGRVRQGLLRPPLAVAICADRSRSLRRRCQQRHRLAATACREQVVADPLGRAAALAKARRCPQMRVDEPFGIELPASGVAEQRVAKA